MGRWPAQLGTLCTQEMVRTSAYFSVAWGLQTQSEPPLGLGDEPLYFEEVSGQGIALLERIYATPSLSGRREWGD